MSEVIIIAISFVFLLIGIALCMGPSPKCELENKSIEEESIDED